MVVLNFELLDKYKGTSNQELDCQVIDYLFEDSDEKYVLTYVYIARYLSNENRLSAKIPESYAEDYTLIVTYKIVRDLIDIVERLGYDDVSLISYFNKVKTKYYRDFVNEYKLITYEFNCFTDLYLLNPLAGYVDSSSKDISKIDELSCMVKVDPKDLLDYCMMKYCVFNEFTNIHHDIKNSVMMSFIRNELQLDRRLDERHLPLVKLVLNNYNRLLTDYCEYGEILVDGGDPNVWLD